MKHAITLLALGMLPVAGALADAPPNPPAPVTTATAADIRAAVRPPALEEALRAALAETSEPERDKQKATFGSDARTSFERQFEEAKVPYCLHGDGLKRQSTFFLSGYIALPFVFVARARGKCLF